MSDSNYYDDASGTELNQRNDDDDGEFSSSHHPSDTYSRTRLKKKLEKAAVGGNLPYSPSTNNDQMSQSQGQSSMNTYH